MPDFYIPPNFRNINVPPTAPPLHQSGARMVSPAMPNGGGYGNGGTSPTPGAQSRGLVLIRGSRTFPIELASVQVLAQGVTPRNFLMLRNASVSPSTAVIFIEFGSTASTLSTLRLAVNESALFDTVIPQDDIYAISDIGGATLSVSFSTLAQS